MNGSNGFYSYWVKEGLTVPLRIKSCQNIEKKICRSWFGILRMATQEYVLFMLVMKLDTEGHTTTSILISL